MSDEHCMNCTNCKYFHRRHVETAYVEGKCHRYPPTRGWDEGHDEQGYPLVTKWDWCGEYVAESTEQEAS